MKNGKKRSQHNDRKEGARKALNEDIALISKKRAIINLSPCITIAQDFFLFSMCHISQLVHFQRRNDKFLKILYVVVLHSCFDVNFVLVFINKCRWFNFPESLTLSHERIARALKKFRGTPLMSQRKHRPRPSVWPTRNPADISSKKYDGRDVGRGQSHLLWRPTSGKGFRGECVREIVAELERFCWVGGEWSCGKRHHQAIEEEFRLSGWKFTRFLAN